MDKEQKKTRKILGKRKKARDLVDSINPTQMMHYCLSWIRPDSPSFNKFRVGSEVELPKGGRKDFSLVTQEERAK